MFHYGFEMRQIVLTFLKKTALISALTDQLQQDRVFADMFLWAVAVTLMVQLHRNRTMTRLIHQRITERGHAPPLPVLREGHCRDARLINSHKRQHPAEQRTATR